MAMGVGKICSYIWFFSRAVVVPGKIVRYEQREEVERKTGREKTMYAAVVSYTFKGETRQATTSISSDSPSQGDIGTILQVGINPKDPNDVRVEAVWQVVLFSIAFIIGGCVFFLFAFFFSPYAKEVMALLSPHETPTYFMLTHPKTTQIVTTVVAPLVKHAGILILGMVGLALTGGGAWLWHSRTNFFKQAIRVPGKVVRYSSYEERDEDSRHTKTMFSEVVSYSFNGETREITSNFSSSSYDEANIGQIRQVGINPNNPYEARIYSKGEFVIAVVLMSVGGLLLLLVLKALL